MKRRQATIQGQGQGRSRGATPARKALCVLCSVALAGGLVPATAVAAFAQGGAEAATSGANAAQELLDAYIADLGAHVAQTSGTSDTDYTSDQLAAAQEEAGLAESLPSAFNLNDLGYVTDVKSQNPWGTCWAFAITAAAETSILSESAGTIGADELDLSERHLAWFTKTHIPDVGEEGYEEDDSQAGEGTWYFDDPGNARMNGGMPFLGTTSYSAGMGAVVESYTDPETGETVEFAPYCNDEGYLAARRVSNETGNSELKQFKNEVDESGTVVSSLDQAKEWGNAEGYTLDVVEYLQTGTWGLDESKRFTQTYALEESSILPSVKPTKNYDGTYSANETGIAAIKSELYDGRAVTIAFTSDGSEPGKSALGSTSRFITEGESGAYNHFTWSEDTEFTGADRPNHGVTIVGWDDDYAAENFTITNPAKWDANQNTIYRFKDEASVLEADETGAYLLNKAGEKVYLDADCYDVDEEGVCTLKEAYRELENDASGNPLIPGTTQKLGDVDDLCDPVTEEGTYTPSGDGAWIVKNSWGSVDSEVPNKGSWGNSGTGYFYISYYDMSVTSAESYDFAVGQETSSYDYSIAYQYDYMSASSVSGETDAHETSMANVFRASQDSIVRNLSCETLKPDSTVEYEVYKLYDGYENPTDGLLVASATAKYDYAGYHRVDLEVPVYLAEGDVFSVVVKESVKNADGSKSYTTILNMAYGEALCEQLGQSSYTKGVVNEGESYLSLRDFEGNVAWADWADVLANNSEYGVSSGLTAVDNFAIKAYADPCEEYGALAEDICVEQGKADDTAIAVGADVEDMSAANFDAADGNGVYVDGAAVDAGNYTVAEDSFTVVLKADYLNTLALGDHYVQIRLKDSEAVTNLPPCACLTLSVKAKETTEVAGANRYATAAQIAQEAYPQGSAAVIVASGENFPDALAASSLAGVMDCPVLLTGSETLSAEASYAVASLGAKAAVIVGGEAAVSEDVEDSLAGLLGEAAVSRVSGDDRYGTAQEIYKEVAESGYASAVWGDTCIVTTGSNYPDALSISGYAFAANAPIFLADGETGLSEDALAAMREGGFTNAVVVGGEEAVSAAVEGALAEVFGEEGVARLAGDDRYETSKAVAEFVIGEGGSTSGACLATGANFPDALAGSALAGKTSGVVLLADDANLCTLDVLSARAADTFQLYYLGGESALSQSVRDAAEEAIGMK